GDELNFCDIDGVRLTRNRDVTTTNDRSRTWSMVGAGLMLGALVLSAVMIFFFPKSPMSPVVVSSQPTSASTASQSAATQTAASTDSQVAALPEVVVEETPPVEVKKREKPASLTDANANTSPLNPKAAALDSEGASTDPRPAASEPPPPVVTPRPEPPPPPRTVSEERAPEPVLKPVQTSDVKKDSKANSKDKDSKKKDDKEKKKGGFFGVFKKIFGKDDKKN
ncbi:MAG TPA: hypothetical protein VJQ56_08140, partial [Blastocatellia bacterium]|nr:hypothetical protein [Blastocatellia bacterium]